MNAEISSQLPDQPNYDALLPPPGPLRNNFFLSAAEKDAFDPDGIVTRITLPFNATEKPNGAATSPQPLWEL
jgi:hypothetical protein